MENHITVSFWGTFRAFIPTMLRTSATMLFTRAFIAPAFALLSTAQTTTTDGIAAPTTTSLTGLEVIPLPLPHNYRPLTAPQATDIVKDIAKYYTSVTAQAEWSSAVDAFTSAIPSSVLTEIQDDPASYIQSVITATTTQDWYTNVPTSYQQYFSSIAAQQKNIVSSVIAHGPAPTHAAKVAGAVMAAGGAALALL